jgi:hypothetical protein
MLDRFTTEHFEPHCGTAFRIDFTDHAPVELVLAQVDAFGGPATSEGRQPFSLLFHGPLTPVLPQRIYPLQHAELGVLEIFIVPLGPDDVGMRYEAVFS